MNSILHHSKRLGRRLSRRKIIALDGPHLKRVFNLFDLIALGVGSTLGLGVYVLAGQVAYNIAGPAVSISFTIAAVASLFAGLCYAEFASRVPRAGSAYIYSYVTMGEFVAFTIGWNLVLEYMVGTASVARGLTCYVDALLNHTISDTLKDLMPVKYKYMSDYPDVISFGMILLLTGVLAFGAKESSWLNNTFTCLNLLTIAIVVIAGATKANWHNWSRSAADVPSKKLGSGGFMPYGWAGVMTGAAKCFYAFIGFDCIATTGEEAINPSRDIPIAILYSLLIIFGSYLSMSVVLTMMMPYYDIDPLAPLAQAFDYIQMIEIKWIVTIGALFALCTCMLGAMFPLPRILYAMAQDGLMFRCFARIHPWTQTPLIATIVMGILTAIIAMIFNLEQLIELGTIGVLLAYTIVALGVVVMRYEDDAPDVLFETNLTCGLLLRQIFNTSRVKDSNEFTDCFVRSVMIIYVLFCIIFCMIWKHLKFETLGNCLWLGFVGFLMLFCMLIIYLQPTTTVELDFTVPFVPLIPCICIFVNIFLMFQFMMFTWVGFLIWIAIGYIIYFTLMLVNFIVCTQTTKQVKEMISLLKFLEVG